LVADNDRVLDVFEFTLGIVGPAAGGEEVQKWIHELIDSPEPMGWANQLQNELTLQLTLSRAWRQSHLLAGWKFLENLNLEMDWMPQVGAALGNVFIYGAGGASLRLGNDLPADFGPPRLRPSLPGSEYFVPSRKFGWYLFLGFEGRAVARNLFLDGNSFQASQSVTKNYLVGDVQSGLALTFGRVRLAFTYVARSKEFTTQRAADQFGALTVSVRI
jgi:hypothetical protein